MTEHNGCAYPAAHAPNNVYVVIYHDVWALGRDPGIQNENGEPEETVIEQVFSTRVGAEAFVHKLTSLNPDTPHTFHTIEEHPLS